MRAENPKERFGFENPSCAIHVLCVPPRLVRRFARGTRSRLGKIRDREREAARIRARDCRVWGFDTFEPQVYNNPVFLKDKRGRAQEAPTAGRQAGSHENATVAERSGG